MNLSRRFSILSLLILGCIGFSGSAQALILRSENELIFDEYVTEDVYLAGDNVTIQQDIEGDLFVASGTVTVNGTISGDIMAAGGTILVNGEVKDDIRLLGGSLEVNGVVGGDLLAIGGDLTLHQDASVEGDVVLLGGSANLYGTINNSVNGIIGRLILGGQVNGNVDVRVTEKLILLKDAIVAGDLTYFAPQKIEDHGGTIGGETSYNEIISNTDRLKEQVRDFFNRAQFYGTLLSYLSLLLIGGLLLVVFSNLFHRTSEQIQSSPLKCFGIGFLVFLVGGFASILSLFTVVGISLSFMAVAILFVLGEVGRIATGYWLGSLLVRGELKRNASSRRVFWRRFGTLALGLLLLKLLVMIPYFGWALGFVFFLTGAGAIFLVQRSNFHHLRKERLI